MAFLSFIFTVVLFFIWLAAVGSALAVIAYGAAIVLGICALTGWIPILMCATDPDFAIGFQYGFVGGWAAIATIIYAASSIGVIILSFVKPDPDGLPPAWKFLSNFYTYKPAATAKPSIHAQDRSWDMKGFSDSLKKGAPSWGYHKATSGAQMREQAGTARKEAERLRRENDKRATEIKEASDLADAMMDLEREKARREGFKETTEK